MARKSAPKVFGIFAANSRLAANAQHGWLSQISLDKRWMKPTFAYTPGVG